MDILHFGFTIHSIVFLPAFRIRRRNSSASKFPTTSSKPPEGRSLLSRSMIAGESLSRGSASTSIKSRLHRSAGSINLCDDALGSSTQPLKQVDPLSAITSGASNTSPVSKNSLRSGQGKPRQLKRRRTAVGQQSKSGSLEPQVEAMIMLAEAASEAPVFRDDCSAMVYSKSIDNSFNTGNGSFSPHRRTRSASGSNTKLGSLWSFICNGNLTNSGVRKENESDVVPS